MEKNNFSCDGKVAVITGGAGFLGREFAKTLSEAGAEVVILDIVPKEKVIEASSLYLHTDITNPEEVEKSVAEIVKKFGRIDILINNAALNPVPGSPASKDQFSAYESYPLELWKKEFDVGLHGAFLLTQKVIPIMQKQKSGSIINISSVYGLVAPNNELYGDNQYKSIAYATVKSALLNFTRTLASYLGKEKIRVNTLVLGGVENEQAPSFIERYKEKTMLGRMASKDDFNGALLLLASDAGTYITGSTLVIDGGWSAW